MVSDKFDGMRLVQRHQLVYALLEAQFAVRPPLGSYRKRVSIQKMSGNDFFYTNSLILLVKNMMCIKPRC